MARYVERAENLARFIDVTLQVILDQPDGAGEQWEPLVRTTGDEKYFAEHYGEFTASNVLQFLTFDPKYPNSILSSLRNARENARTIREAISSESWEQLNTYYHYVKSVSESRDVAMDCEFYESIRQHSHLFSGTLDATMTRGDGWHFAHVGSLTERADKTSRILDVKYFTLLRSISDVDTTFDDLLWSAVLRSVSGFEMFRKRHHSLTIHRVIHFLVLDSKFPRSVRYCVEQAQHSLAQVAGPVATHHNPAILKMRALMDELGSLDAQSIIDRGMHEFVDAFQGQLNEIGAAINETYFADRSFVPPRPKFQRQTQFSLQ
jgi:uncharacterized alpha-E superfamily protein